MTELDLLIDFHRDARRQGPGTDAETLKALEITGLRQASGMRLVTGQSQTSGMKPSEGLRIADIGCGTGAQTLTLAAHLNGHITAVDLFPAFLDELNKASRAAGFSDRIRTLEASMDALPFGEGEFDLIWSEGAIYNMGFEAGLQAWRPFLKSGGWLAVSELTWFTATRPSEIEEHWNREYPGTAMASENFNLLERNGFSPAGYFLLSDAAWIDQYYRPMEKRMEAFISRHRDSAEREAAARRIVEENRKEYDLYRRFKAYVGYGFYIARRVDA
jgi:ubiquinone/menaquinone biosynthesis C-methylase UbiE